MTTLFVLVGTQGSGKTSLIQHQAVKNLSVVLKPSTTRGKRHDADEEYHFVDPNDWDSQELAWSIDIGPHKYGMREDDLLDISARTAVTVFDPGTISKLNEWRQRSSLNVVTIGLDTIKSVDDQVERVGRDDNRLMTNDEFHHQRETVRQCDVVLTGDFNIILDALKALLHLDIHGGGIVDGKTLKSLTDAGTVLINPIDTDLDIESASIDLHLGDEVWLKGKILELNPTEGITIPAYSYAIVKASELACLPRFMTGRFDLTVSLFNHGFILSNGPQIDPGYKGALFCLLYNASDEPVTLVSGEHFATIEFVTTTQITVGYHGRYQGKERLSDFLDRHAKSSAGGQLLERIDTAANKSATQLQYGLAAIALFIAMGLGMASWLFQLASDTQDLNSEIEAQLAMMVEFKKELGAYDRDTARVKSEPTIPKSDNKFNSATGDPKVEGAKVETKRLSAPSVNEDD